MYNSYKKYEELLICNINMSAHHTHGVPEVLGPQSKGYPTDTALKEVGNLKLKNLLLSRKLGR